MSDNRWIKETSKQETRKECNSNKDEIILMMQTEGKKLKKNSSKKIVRKKDFNSTEKKEMQSEIYNRQGKKCNIWLG